MKALAVSGCILLIAWLLIYEWVAGSSWSFVPDKDLILYQHVDAPIDKLPIVATIGPGEKLSVLDCTFDKDDAFLLVASEEGKRGYTFETRHQFRRSWRLVTPRTRGVDFPESWTCMRLIGQFGNAD